MLLMLPTLALVLPTVLAASPPASLYAPSLYSKVLSTALRSSNPSAWPANTNPVTANTWILDSSPEWWTSSFFSSSLYLLQSRHSTLCPSSSSSSVPSSRGVQGNGSDTDWLALARTWSRNLYAPLAVLTNTHDLGFMSYPAVAELERDAGNQTARGLVMSMARNLANRFSSVVGCTRSWDSSGGDDFAVIIDNMMNLQLLIQGAALTGNRSMYDMATSHANKTMANHLRADASSFHVVNYSALQGGVNSKRTAQGYADSSTWSRGQSWGIFGFALMYNSTGILPYLETARSMAALYLSRLPSYSVPYWDFDAPLSD